MQTVLITGASSGYGLETARYFHDQGWRVIATMRTPREDILQQSTRMRVLPLDVTEPDSIATALKAAGSIDALVNNAGIGLVGAFEATPMSYVRKVFETNTFGVMAMTQAVIPQFRDRRSGVIVNVTSIAGHRGFEDHVSYAASKAGLEGATRVMARELGRHGIRVLALAPTVTMTELAAEAWSDPAKSEPMMARHPAGRFAQAEDVARAIALLLSEDASMMTGSVLPVDGGFLSV